jgi:hypothetical protein
MEFQGPDATDYDNVRTLNLAFLSLLRRDRAAAACLRGLPAALAARLVSLSEAEATRLATTPFLLMSFRERDHRFWDTVFTADTNQDLFAVQPTASDEFGRLISAGLGFVWQLAKRNPYAARLTCGAGLRWCEQLTEHTFFRLLAVTGMRAEVLVLRRSGDVELWTKLLQNGTSRELHVRRAAQVSALQSILTQSAKPSGQSLAAAACRVQTPSLKVAEETKSR